MLFITIAAPLCRRDLIQASADFTWSRSALPLAAWGVPVATSATSPSGVSTASRWSNRSRPRAMADWTISSRPGS